MALTQEHLLAAWVDKLFPDAASSLGTIISSRSSGATRLYNMLPFEQTVRDFCARCNGGWMNDLENQVAPFLGPMVRDGRPTRLTQQMQSDLAAWAVKTACVLQRFYPADSVIPASEYHSFYNEKRALPKQFVWIANRFQFTDVHGTGLPNLFTAKWKPLERISYDNTISHDSMRQQLLKGAKAYRIAFALGRVVFLVFGHTLEGGMKLFKPRRQVIELVWPVRVRVKWPPPTSIEAIGGFEALHNSLEAPP